MARYLQSLSSTEKFKQWQVAGHVLGVGGAFDENGTELAVVSHVITDATGTQHPK